MKADINVTPLIDVLLVLLIIFMLVTPVAPRGLDASLPEPGKDADRATTAESLVLEVRVDGFAVNTTPAWTPAELADRLRSAFEARSDRTLFVRVAAGVPYERVVEALDVADEAGAGRIGLVADDASPRE